MSISSERWKQITPVRQKDPALSMADCYFAKPNGMQHCCIPFFMLLIPNALLILAKHNLLFAVARKLSLRFYWILIRTSSFS